MSLLKKFTGSSWVDIQPKKFSGGKWVECEVLQWNGTSWSKMTMQQYTATFECNWTGTYDKDNDIRGGFRSADLCQGRYTVEPWGLQRSLAGFPEMASTLAGARIDNVLLYLKNEHWYYYSGGTAVIGYHNHDLKPSKFSHSKYGAVYQKYTERGQAKWIDMPNSFGEGIRDGDYKGFSIFANSENISYYGAFHGASDGSYKPKIKVTYTK